MKLLNALMKFWLMTPYLLNVFYWIIQNKKEDPKPEEKEEAEPKINKEDDCDFETKVAEIVEKILAKKEEEAKQKEGSEPVDEKKEEDTPKITKSQKVVITNENITHTNYYEMTGRDPVTGKKLRN